MISPNDVKKAAELARIKLSTEEEKGLAGELESVLGYIEKLKEVDVGGVEKSGNVFHFNDFRKDGPPKENFDPKPLIDAAASTERGFIKVKKILDKE